MINKIGKALFTQFTTDWKILPSAAINRRTKHKYYWSGDFNTTWVTQWLPYQWPLCPDAAFASGVEALISRIDEDSSNWTPRFGHFNALFQKKRPWHETGHLLLCLGLVGKDADSKGLAIDAIIEGIDSGQFDPKVLAAVLSELSNSGWLKLNRLGDNLMQVIQTSPLHAWVISDCIQRWLLNTDITQRNFYHVLDGLLEARAQSGQNLSTEVREALKGYKGSGKAAKLAKKLLDSDCEKANVAELKRLAISVRLGMV